MIDRIAGKNARVDLDIQRQMFIIIIIFIGLKLRYAYVSNTLNSVCCTFEHTQHH